MAVSSKHALSEEERRFCLVYLAFGKKNSSEAYRRAFLTKYRTKWYLPEDVNLENGRPSSLVADRDEHGQVKLPKPISAQDVSKKAIALLGQDYIDRYLTEIVSNPGDAARDELADQVRFAGTDQARRAAAERILADEDKLGFKDATERWAEIMCDIGAEVVVPLPDGSEHVVPFSTMMMIGRATSTPTPTSPEAQSDDGEN